MRRLLLLVGALLLVAPSASAQQGAPDPTRRAALEARRDSLEAAVMQRFVDQLHRELRLDAEQRAQTERVLRDGGLRRRELMRASGELRSRLHRGIRAADTPDAEFHRLLAEHETLRHRENELWRREQDELAGILSPRQRAQFLVQWVRFQDQVRDILAQQLRAGGSSRH
jgi:Spy/CpxP family protein refolding chaperone